MVWPTVIDNRFGTNLRGAFEPKLTLSGYVTNVGYAEPDAAQIKIMMPLSK